MRVLHLITRMIIGGAQENTLYNCLDLMRDFNDDVCLATGPTYGPEGKLLEQGRAGELHVEIVPSLQREISPRTDWKCRREIRRLIEDFEPDVVHTHSAKAGFLGRLAAADVGVPAIFHTVHGAPFHPYQSALARNLFVRCERVAAKRCHRMISVADAMTDLMVGAKVAPRDKFQTIYSGMDIEPFLAAGEHRDSVRAQFGFAPGTIVIGKIARLFKLKGHDDLLEAAATVIDQVPAARFLLVGDGLLRDELEERAQQLGISDQIVFAGLVPPEEIPRMVSAMDILTHTSLREGLARTLPQALLSGIPVVSYDVDGAREVCISNETGFLIPPRDLEEFAQRLVELCRDEEARLRMGSQGQQMCRERFPHRHMTAQIRELYERVLQERPPLG